MNGVAALAALESGALAGARTLSLAGAGLDHLPEAIDGLVDTLELLDLADNRLDTLPPWLARFGQLRTIFLSRNRFAVLPPVLGACPALRGIGCRDGKMESVPAEALPPALEWLTLTGNRLAAVPAAFGQRPHLRKLLLAGNRLGFLPPELEAARALELLRLGSNRLEHLPSFLATLPRLAWFGGAGNGEAPRPDTCHPVAHADEIEWGEALGEGSAGRVRAGTWRGRPVAIKLWRATLASDGAVRHERDAALGCGAGDGLLGGLARLDDHPSGSSGLVMPRAPATWRPLAKPPGLFDCTRDTWKTGFSIGADAARRLLGRVAAAGARMHAHGFIHGDLYGHNVLWDGVDGDACLGDLGAATPFPDQERPWPALDVLAWGVLADEIRARADAPFPPALDALRLAALDPEPARRPGLRDIADAVGAG